MAYLEPNGIIEIFENISLDNSYNNSLWFDSLSDQTNYFNSQTKRTYPRCYYTRKNRGFIRVKDKADTLYRYNYMRYKNASHTNKWIYCFILSVDYINENTTQINYEVDLIQTYMFDIVIRDSFVDRQHSLTDEIGDNLIEENLKIGPDYIVEKNDTIVDLTPNRFCFMLSKQNGSVGDLTPPLSMINSYFAKVAVLITRKPSSKQDLDNINSRIKLLTSQIADSNILCAFMYNSFLDDLLTEGAYDLDDPNVLAGGNSQSGSGGIYTIGSKRDIITPSITLTNKFGNYTAKNNKLLTYPYKCFYVVGADNDSQTYKYELFLDKSNIKFDLRGAVFPYPQYMLLPLNYMGTDDNGYTYPMGYACSIKITDYPIIPYANDTFKGYLLQTRGSRLYALGKTVSSVFGAMGSFGSSSIVGGTIGGGGGTTGTSLIPYGGTAVGQPLYRAMGDELPSTDVGHIFEANLPKPSKLPYESPSATEYSYGHKANPAPTIFSMIAGDINAKGLPNTLTGSFTSDGLLVSNKRYIIEYFQYCIKPEYAKIIDEYFTMYGYKMNALMGVISPSSTNNEAKRKRRKQWNYTKTVGCNVEKSVTTIGCTAGEMTSIAEIYDKGITFWQPYHTIGDYTGDNTPRA